MSGKIEDFVFMTMLCVYPVIPFGLACHLINVLGFELGFLMGVVLSAVFAWHYRLNKLRCGFAVKMDQGKAVSFAEREELRRLLSKSFANKSVSMKL